MLGPATFDTLPCGRPFRTAPPDQIAFDCSVTSNPTVAGQQIIVEDANGAVLERWEVINVAEVPFGRMIPVWRGTAYQQPAAGSIAPFKITASNFGPGDAWSLTIAGLQGNWKMSLHNSGGAIHQNAGMLGPTFVIPATATYWVDMETDGGLVQLVNAASGAVLANGTGTVSLTKGVVVQFKGINVPANAKFCGGRIIEYDGLGGER